MDAANPDRSPDLDRSTLAQRIRATCLLSGEFVVRSGQVTDHYFDKYLFEADPVMLRAVAHHAAPLIPDGIEVLAGLELGGVPVVTALSLHTGKPAAFVRKEAKTYGTAKLAEGAPIDGRRVLIVEDVITTGGQVVESAAELRSRGARVDTVLCIIDRTRGDHTALDDADLNVRALFGAAELMSA